ncbi:MAG: TonB-dependent receptor [Winogradskyella sp.]|nr:TonB-dependent receptor [Winogradskyella sp.]
MVRILTCFFCFISLLAYSQNGTISGSLTLKNGMPVLNAHVYIKQLNKFSVTNENGNFELKNIPYGTHKIEVTSIEILDTAFTVEVNNKQKTITLTVNPSEDVELTEVLVLGKSKEKIIETQGFAVDVIKTKEASLRNVQTNELLNQTVGVRIRQNGGLGSDVNYNINGMSGNAIRIFIDGIPISTYGSSFDLNSIPPSMIERIEVYKGVVPGHLSDDSLGGAINVVLKKDAKNNLNVSASYGSFNTSQLYFNGFYRFKESGFTVKASGFFNYSDNDYEVWGSNVYNILPNGRLDYVRAKRFNDAYRSLGGVIEAGFTDVKWADNFFIGFTGTDSYKEIQHGAFMTIPYKGRFAESDASLVSLTYSKKDILTKGLEFNLQGLYGERNRVINDTVKWNYNWYGEKSLDLNGQPILRPQGAQQGAPTIANINRKVASVRTGLAYTLNPNHKFLLNHLFTVVDRKDDDEIRSVLERMFMGTRYLRKNITSLSYELTAFNSKLKTSVFGKNYHQYIERINPTVETIDGEQVRVEDVVNNNSSIQGYGIASSYQVWQKMAILASAEKAVRLPNENEVFGDAGDNIVENPNIKPETSNNINLGFKFGTFTFKKHDFMLSTNLFFRNIKDRIGTQVQTSLNSNLQVLPFENQGDVISKGIDAELNYTFNNNLNIALNASKLDITYKNQFNERKVPNEPTFTVNASAQYFIRHIIQKDAQLNFFYNFMFVDTFNYLLEPYGNNAGTDFFDVPQQFIHDAGLSYAFPSRKLVVSFDVKNIFNKRAFDNFAVQKPGRAFYLKLNYTINNL